MARSLRAACLLAATFACQSVHGRESEFAVPREQIRAQVKRVALLPTGFEEDWPRNAAFGSEAEQYATQLLGAAGIDAVPSNEYAGTVDRLKREAGGWFDPASGRLVKEKRAEILARARSELCAQQHVQAQLQLRVDVVHAFLVATTASWHGAEESTSLNTGGKRFMESLISGDVRGSLPALSVAAILVDCEGKQMYGRYGGLQLLSVVDMNLAFVEVDPDFLFSDPVRNQAAVRRALRPLLYTSAEIREQDQAQRQAANGIPAPKPAPFKRARIEPPQPALRVPAADLHGQVRVLALRPLKVLAQREMPDPRERIEATVTRILESDGFKVVPSAAYEEIYTRRRAAITDLFDPMTGTMVEARRIELRDAVYQELHERFGADASMELYVVETAALRTGSTVSWDGVQQSMAQSDNTFTKAIIAMNDGTSYVPALSLAASISGAGGQELFVKRTGVQTLRRMNSLRELDVTPDKLLTDEARNAAAVQILLEELGPSAAQPPP